MKRILSIFCIILALTLTLTACSGAPTSDPDNGAEEGEIDLSEKEVVVILKNLTNPFWISVKEGAEKAAEELGVKISVIAPLKAESNEEQSQMIEQSIVNQADIIVLAPSDSKAIVPAVIKLKEANIPLINLNTGIEADEVMWESFVAIENYDVGYNAAKRLLDMMDGEGEIIIIEGVTGAQTSIDRVKGAQDAIEEYPNVKLVAQQSADYNRATSMDVVQNLLQSYPNVKAIFAANDEMALGAVEAIDSAGKTGNILISGIDANADAREAVKNDKMALTADGQPFNQGYQSVVYAVKALQGEKLEEFIRLDVKILGKEDLE